MSEQSNLKRHQHCPMRTHVGNCINIGGFCTSIREDICDALHKSFQMGTRSRAVDKANDDAISRDYLEELYQQTLIPKGMINTDVELGINIGVDKMHDVIKNAPSVVPKAITTVDTLLIAAALRDLAQDSERNMFDRKRAEALREQILAYGASMCQPVSEP